MRTAGAGPPDAAQIRYQRNAKMPTTSFHAKIPHSGAEEKDNLDS
jgi:hypothetical protein